MFTIKEILESTGGRLIRGSLDKRVSGVAIDSRTIKPDELFVAIRGKRFNGHSFITQAGFRGAGAILFSDINYIKPASTVRYLDSIPLIKVEDTVLALGALAHYHRARFNISVIAITGSNGKTTTKEMLRSILAKRFNVLYNPGTQNNQIGVPLAMLSLCRNHTLAVIEIGASQPGEIDRLSWIIMPSIGIITNIGPSHLEFFKDLKGVFKVKSELIKNLPKKGKIVINNDDRFLSGLKDINLKTITFGFSQTSNFYGQIIRQTEKGILFLINGRHRVRLKVLGRHNVYNALASVAVARNFNITYSEIREALDSFQPLPMRMQILNINNVKIINDCYNSNPASLGCALDFLSEYSNRGKKIVVCGDMMELGPEAEKLHLDIGKRIARDRIDFLVTVGSLSKNIASGAHSEGMSRNLIRSFNSTSGAAGFLQKFTKPDDIVLIKGSRAMQMENVIKCFTSSSTH